MAAQMPFGVIFPIAAAQVFDETGSYRGFFMSLRIALIRRPGGGARRWAARRGAIAALRALGVSHRGRLARGRAR